MDSASVIVAGARTPVGKFLGGLSSLAAYELGGLAIAEALRRAGIEGAEVDQVVMGHAVQAGTGQAPARRAAALGGIPATVFATTVNTVCLSGIDAVIQADRLIRLGEAEIVVAGGMESMSQAPHLQTVRSAVKYGRAAMEDSLEHDGLWDWRTNQSMGSLTDAENAVAAEFSREEQDAYAAGSHQRAAAAQADGSLTAEIVPVQVAARKQTIEVAADEGVRPDTTAEALAKLPPAFSPDGTITAGSASPLSDGAAAVVVMSRAEAERRGLSWLAEVGTSGQVAGPDSSLQLQPSRAIFRALERAGLSVEDLDLVEINEAFAAVALASIRDLGADPEIVNPTGGAVALGHPLGMSGARLVLSIATALERRGGGTGVASLCGGSGQGSALILTRPRA
ncbi:acetyl-CoA C-acetyltransferase [Lysobacter korlensis]|uniref:Acetyl-CoA C-acetyltransferase n=1 Tax=Lysobacter korlensis TaxID=553636 RepID=A0ABV6RX64_9GAMM